MTLKEQLHSSATHKPGKDSSCPACNPATTAPPKGFWTLENIQAAKALVREIVTIADLKGTLRPNDADAVVAKARIIMGAVRSNQPVEDIKLPL